MAKWSWGGAGSGALSGATFGSAFGPIGTIFGAGAGGAMGGLSGGGRGVGGGGYGFQPYSGMRPPPWDEGEKKTLQPVKNQWADLLMKGTGEMSPEAMQILGSGPYLGIARELFDSRMKRVADDARKQATGRVSSAGLGGNLAARQAIEGQTEEDIAERTKEGHMELTLDDLARANQNRSQLRVQLPTFTQMGFNHENRRADFDKSIWLGEQGLATDWEGLGQRQQVIDEGLDEGFGGGIAGLLGNFIPQTSDVSSLSDDRKSGMGVGPFAEGAYNRLTPYELEQQKAKAKGINDSKIDLAALKKLFGGQ